MVNQPRQTEVAKLGVVRFVGADNEGEMSVEISKLSRLGIPEEDRVTVSCSADARQILAPSLVSTMAVSFTNASPWKLISECESTMVVRMKVRELAP